MSEVGNGQTSDPLGLDRGGEDTSPRPAVAVTEQEQKLRDSLVAAERDLRQILHTSPVGISISTVRDGRVVDMNDEFLHILGFDRGQVIGRTSAELRLWTAAGQRESIVRELRERGTCPPRPVTMRRRDGSLVTVLFSVSALATGEEPHAIAWVMDITDRLRAEEELRASEEKWRTLVASAPVIILTVDRSGRILTSSRSLVGRKTEEIIGRCVHDFTVGEGERKRSVAILERVFREGVSLSFEVDSSTPSGRRMRMRNVFAPLRSAAGEVTTAIGVGMDVTPEHDALEALHESEQRFRDIVQSLGDWVWEVDAAGRLTYAAPQIEGLLGYTAQEMVGTTPWHTCVPEDCSRNRAVEDELRRHPRPFRDREIWHLHKDGRRVCLSVSGVPMVDAHGVFRGYRGVAHDVTERRREEAEVQQARRVESLGLLAGGIAHDFNNLLTAILGNAELAFHQLPEGGARQLVEQIQVAGEHAARLTRQMLTYAGRGILAVERVDLSVAVREMEQLLGASIPKKLRLDLELADGLPAVELDPAQLRQVVMNLVLNAADAIGDRQGRIEVRTCTCGPTDGFPADFELGQMPADQERVCVEVADSGSGITPGDLAKIFDPYFTTKFTGRGLGLAAVRGIVLRHGGMIAVQTAPGSGSTFRVSFPALSTGLADAAPAAPARSAPSAADAGSWRGSGSILLVDDEEPVRRIVASMLGLLGFQVVAASDGREAVAAVEADAGLELRAVLLDLTMPHMDGRETFRELRRLRADLPVLLCSGYEVLEDVVRFAGMGFSGFLNKPYRLDDLAQQLRRALRQ